jgi:hypothetical protein
MSLLELRQAFEKLLATNFHVSRSIVQRLLEADMRRTEGRR